MGGILESERSISVVSSGTSPVVDAVRPLTSKSLFWKARYLHESDALCHIPFLFWLVEASHPQLIVAPELGDGVGYFALCQSVERNGFDTRCFAFTEAAGGQEKRAYNDEQYEDFSTIKLSTPAPQQFANDSIDLLYIEADTDQPPLAVLKDWRMKLTNRAVIVLSGTADLAQQELDELLEEAGCVQGKSFSFEQGAGLTVILRGESRSDRLERLVGLRLGVPGYGEVQVVFNRLGNIHRVEHRLRVLKSDLSYYKNRASHEKKRAEQIEAAYQALQEELTKLHHAYDQRSSQVALAQAKLFDLQKRVEAGAIALAQANARIETLNEAASRTETEHQKLLLDRDSSRAALQRELERVQGLLVEAELDRERLTRQVLERDRQIATRDGQIAGFEAARQEKEAEVSAAAQEKILLLETSLAEATAQIETLTAAARHANDEHQKVLSERDANIEALQRDLAQAQRALDEIRHDRDKLAQHLAKRDQEVAAQNEQIAALEAKHEREVAAQAEANAEAEKRALVLETSLAQAIVQREEIESERDKVQRKLTDQKVRFEQLEQAFDKLKHDHASTQSERDRLLRELADANAKCEALQQSLDAAKDQAASFEMERHDLLEEIGKQKINEADLTAEVERQKESIAQRFEEIAKLTRLLEERSAAQTQADADIAALKQELSQTKTEHARVAKERDRIQAELSSQRTLADQLKQELEALRNGAAAAETERQRLLEEIGRQTTAAAAHEHKIAKLQAELSARFREIAQLTQLLEKRAMEQAEKAARTNELMASLQRMQEDREIERELASAELMATRNSTRRGYLRRLVGASERAAFARQLGILRGSALFDARWYLEEYPDVAQAQVDPAEHYLFFGAREGRNPGPNFDTYAYYRANRDVSRAGYNALIHFELSGQTEARVLPVEEMQK